MENPETKPITTYTSSKGEVEIKEMNNFHLFNAVLKVKIQISEASVEELEGRPELVPTFDALKAEVFVRMDNRPEEEK